MVPLDWPGDNRGSRGSLHRRGSGADCHKWMAASCRRSCCWRAGLRHCYRRLPGDTKSATATAWKAAMWSCCRAQDCCSGWSRCSCTANRSGNRRPCPGRWPADCARIAPSSPALWCGCPWPCFCSPSATSLSPAGSSAAPRVACAGTTFVSINNNIQLLIVNVNYCHVSMLIILNFNWIDFEIILITLNNHLTAQE